MDIDPRYDVARQFATNIRAKAEELSTAIYEARKMGFETVLRIDNGRPIGDNRFQGADLVVRATIDFHIGEAL